MGFPVTHLEVSWDASSSYFRSQSKLCWEVSVATQDGRSRKVEVGHFGSILCGKVLRSTAVEDGRIPENEVACSAHGSQHNRPNYTRSSHLEYNWVDSNRLRYGCVKPEHLWKRNFFRSLPGEKGEKGGATEKEKEKARQIGEMIRFDDYFQLGCNYQMVAILFLRSMKYDDLILRGTSNKFVTCASEYCGSFTFEAMHFGCPSHPLCKILKNQP